MVHIILLAMYGFPIELNSSHFIFRLWDWTDWTAVCTHGRQVSARTELAAILQLVSNHCKCKSIVFGEEVETLGV